MVLEVELVWLLLLVAAVLIFVHALATDPPRLMLVAGQNLLLAAAALSLVLALFGCGTRPLQVKTSPPVPAALLIPPRPPVLLAPVSPLTTPGTTTPATPSNAPKTGWATSA